MAYDQRLADTLVELADTLVDDFDVVDLMQTLAERSVDLLGAAEAGLMVVDEQGSLRIMASTSERGRLLELFELQNEEGPCLECFRTGKPVTEGATGSDSRWPRFAAEVAAAGFAAAHALPLRLRGNVIGALNLFHTSSQPLSSDDIGAGQALADIATIGILQHRALREMRVVVEQLQGALNSRVTIEQAKGILAERGSMSVTEAFDLMRSFARGRRLRLHDVAVGVIEGSTTLGDLRRPAGP